ncbi:MULTISPECIES: RpiB/LacA/LacB family sugar-phosphate isomerase [Pseudoalteromonas]|uniref:RpiB/LacA/LacB family sugar-phosphate isomerase n=1 Tax=Pseudoalteromonas TaxID=53246 RepID=UPI001602E975|nr:MULTISPECIES: RpiB/LacA/LacB family sugar-phosphate isomerase [Pseudoalteromonas]MBB1294027.1 RpiB/LacA/LacB family sugar-phosphate isomerase [Pseudoalteromonas sp. SR41-4]MBB1301425.1 RpiB/LacA/LacB family sugar-phosphate isomerase [Pseudoalteromonas sp. SR44-8]MBB1311444.1 RpiB/LacA/LacB family sugar-phosphate isomerase [Pseudoalteromonas sp. SR41-8]MBB1408261.1 RpiB/LacA/LacB family sugar-phosphate isomerase [Pseudoalteromonas sp. SG44-17]MBB1505524.1 RpiB/LacA/LacB family sugar-phosphat|tara:strand:+ start:5409 stop:6041 length:633 start_codon:yes stop_codon:yes gene_type:complete
MKIALMNEFSQAAKNPTVLEQLNTVANAQNHQVFNVGMDGDNDHRLTYIHLGIIASLLLNSKAVDFVVTGCGTGQGALMASNAFPGVTCGYCIDPSDAYLFAQINNGNALALPYAKGFGWGAELNIKYIFEKAFTGEKGQGYPAERKESQVTNAGILNQLKADVAKDYLSALEAIDPELIKQAIGGPRFQECFFTHCQDDAIAAFVKARI